MLLYFDFLSQMFAQIEVDLNLLGVSAIEDKLQDGVQLTITRLRRAGIKVCNLSKVSSLIRPCYLQPLRWNFCRRFGC
jgi:hypothetical protein